MFGGKTLGIPKVGRQIWKTGPIIDQKEESACVGFDWLEFLMAEPNPYPVPADTFHFAMQIYRRAQQLDDSPGEEPEYYGTTVEAGHAALLEMGLVKPEIFWATTIDQVIKHLLEIGPVSMGTDWTRSMMETNEEGYVFASGLSVGGHCYLCHGVDIKAETLFFQQSWGLEYGIDGKFKMSFSTMEKLLRRSGYGISTFEEAK